MSWSFTKAASVTLLGLVALIAIAGAGLPQDSAGPALPYEGTESIAGTLGEVDVMCILRTWRIKGVGFCYNGLELRVCLWVENAFPSGVFEVVRQPLKTHYGEMKGILGALEPLRSFGVSSNHTALAGDGTSNHFAEARVYTFIPPIDLQLSEIPIAKPSGPFWQVNYVSELDAFAWRSPVVDALTAPETLLAGLKSCDRVPDPMTCAGRWGSYYPRIGFVNHPSPPMAAYLQALRAGRAASRPIGRITLGPYPFEPRTGHYIQMLRPTYRPCTSIGFPFTKLLETAASSRWGAYVFMHYGIFEECRRCTPVILTGPRAPM